MSFSLLFSFLSLMLFLRGGNTWSTSRLIIIARDWRRGTTEPRFNEVAGDRPNLFVKSRVRYIENLDITNLRGNDQNVRYIEVTVNDWFVTQVASVTQFNAIFVTQKCRVLGCNSLSMVAFSSNYFHFWTDAQLLFTKERHFQSCDLKMLQHGGYRESEEVNRTNKSQRR